ncbi:MAG: exosome complex protein Rrp42 [Candidatus Micrarchaeota archaeon]|nr:exosome complex protein Rrp42 [Candidatus Micrarchaeota archaeon]
MGEEFKDIVLHQMRKDMMVKTFKTGQRFDGRKFDELRPLEIQKGNIHTAEASSLVKLGLTQVLVGIKFDVLTPFADRPDEGVIMSNAELSPVASPTFETGPPDENSIELARVVDRGIRSAECINLKSLFIEEGKVLAVFIDIYALNHAGNLVDAASIAAIAALTDAKMPKVENGKIVRGEFTGKLPLSSLPVAVTSIKCSDYWLVDPSLEEEYVKESKITIATTDKHVCAIQKGKGTMTRKELDNAIEIAFKRGDDIRNVLKH